MANYTKGEWMVGKSFRQQDYPIYAEDHYEIARIFMHNGEQEANAQRIVDCVNGCKDIDPLAIKDLYEALKELMERFNGGTRFPLQSTCDKANEALAKAREK